MPKKNSLFHESNASANDNFQGSFAKGVLDKTNENNITANKIALISAYHSGPRNSAVPDLFGD